MFVERLAFGTDVNIEIWSDVICPFCGLGNHRLDTALAAFEHREDVTVVHRSFQLDPSSPEGTTITVKDMLAAKYGMTGEQVEANNGRLEATAEAEGLVPYVVTENRVGNTAMAHELLAFAAASGLEDRAWEVIYRAYFGEVRSIFDLESLVAIGADIGLDPEQVRQVLTDRRFAEQIASDAQEAKSLGANGVPFIVIDRKYTINGAQPLDVFERALEVAWSERTPALVPLDIEFSDGAACGPDGCD